MFTLTAYVFKMCDSRHQLDRTMNIGIFKQPSSFPESHHLPSSHYSILHKVMDNIHDISKA